MASMTADETIRTAEECFELDLITEDTLKRVTSRALADPEYDPICDLPFSWEIQHERELRRAADRRARRSRRPLLLRWLP